MTTDAVIEAAPVTPAAVVAAPAAPAAGDDKAAPATGADAPVADAAPAVVWPSDWREKAAGEDQAKLNILKRYTDPNKALESLFALQEKVRSNDLKKPLAKDATPEQTVEWRKANGIPDAPEAYLKTLPEGVVFGDQDKAAIDGFLKEMHGRNASPDIVAAALQSYNAAQKAATEERGVKDAAALKDTEATLKSEWGTDFTTNIGVMKGFLESSFPAGVQEALINARLGDENQTPLLCHPDIIRAFAQLGRDLNPAGTISGGRGMDSMDSMNDLIKGYEARMGQKEWFRDEKSQSHYRELITARDRLTGKK